MDKPVAVSGGLAIAGLSVSAFLFGTGLQVGGWNSPVLGVVFLVLGGGAAWFSFVHWIAVQRIWRWLVVGWLVWLPIGGVVVPCSLDRWIMVPSPSYELWLEEYQYMDGLVIEVMGERVTWHPNYRIYHARISNPRISKPMLDTHLYLELPAVVRRQKILEAVSADGAKLEDSSRGELSRASVVEVSPSGESRTVVPAPTGPVPPGTITGVFISNNNQVVLWVPSLRPAGFVELQLLVDYAVSCNSQRGKAVSEYSYNSLVGQARKKQDRFLLTAKADPPTAKTPSHALEFVSVPPECPPYGGSICMAAGRESLIDEPMGKREAKP
jgi:hypothetical protein